MKKIILDSEEVILAYKEIGNLDKVAKTLGVCRPALTRFMDENNIPRKVIVDFTIDKDELQKSYNDLNNTRKVAEKYGVCRSVIKRLCSEHGIVLNQKQPPERLLPDIIRLTNEGKNNFEIAEVLLITPSYVNEVARQNGIKLNHRYHKGYIITNNGYKMIRAKENPDADSKGYVREHRMILAKKLNLPFLPKDKICHHKDGIKLNNDPDNLEVMTLSDHAKLHWKGCIKI